jgi:tetratricopeptide (TPR) repeat protein
MIMQDDLNIALGFHQRGNLQEAARSYQGVLARRPDDAQALNLLGVVALQQGNPRRAVELIGRAIALSPAVAAFHCNVAEAYRLLGQLERAISSCRTALQLQPHYPEADNNLGLALFAQGQAEAAIAHFRAALRLNPKAAMCHNNLANALRTQGDKVQALAHYRQALQLDPHLPEAHSNLGQFLLEQHQLSEAVVHCREAVQLRPGFAEAHNNLGNVLREQGVLEEAKACYALALRLNPNAALIYNNMGQAVQEEGKLDEAGAWYQKALEIEPGSARIHANLASALEQQDKQHEAIARYQIALRFDPNYAEAHNGLGFVQHEQGQYQEALAHYRQAIRLKPDFAPAHSNLGAVLEEVNDSDGAQASFREALRHDPRDAGAYAQLATMLGGKLPDTDMDAMRSLLAEPFLKDDKHAALHFGLAHALDARGAYDEAAEHLQKANVLRLLEWRKQGKGYDALEHTRFVDNLIAGFTADFFRRVRGFGLETQRPIFIIGLPRSGTTLTEQILASHSQVFGAGELRLARETFEALFIRGARDEGGGARDEGQEASGFVSPRACRLSPLATLDRATAGRLAQTHLDQLARLNQEASRVADKMPDNYLYLGLLAILFPRARFIHCRRDLRDVAVSCWMTNFRHIRWANDAEHLAARFREYLRLMEHWRQVLPMPVLEIHYEDTVTDLEGTARSLIGWCGLEWEPACLAFHQNRRPVRTASVAQVRQPVYTRAVARWKHYEKSLAGLFAQVEAHFPDRAPTHCDGWGNGEVYPRRDRPWR